jgi:hypothetical protein
MNRMLELQGDLVPGKLRNDYWSLPHVLKLLRLIYQSDLQILSLRYHREVGEWGRNTSQAKKQRIAIAHPLGTTSPFMRMHQATNCLYSGLGAAVSATSYSLNFTFRINFQKKGDKYQSALALLMYSKVSNQGLNHEKTSRTNSCLTPRRKPEP